MTFTITYETLFDLLRKEKSREDLQALPEDFYAEVRGFLERRKAETAAANGSAGGSNGGGSNGGGAVAQRAAIELANIRKIMKEFYERRERKTLLLALNKARTESAIIDPSILLPSEKQLFDQLVNALRTNKSAILSGFGLENGTPVVVEVEPIAGEEKEEESGREVVQEEKAQEEQEEVAQQKEQVKEEEKEEEESSPEPAPASPSSDSPSVTFLKDVPRFVGKDMSIYGPYEKGASAELPDEIVVILKKKGFVA